MLSLLQAIALATNQAATVEEAAGACLRAVCGFMRWPIGHLYLRSTGDFEQLIPTNVWHLDDSQRFRTFLEATETTPLAQGRDLPGRVLACKEPVWVEDLTKEPNFPRQTIAAEIGVRAGFAFPIVAAGEVFGVLEFFSVAAEKPHLRMLEIGAHIGMQLGIVVERATAERALRESEMRFRSVAQSANDAIISADTTGSIVFWNTGATQIFGYSEAEAMGQQLIMLMPARYRDAHQRGLARLASTGESRVIGRVVELEGLRKDGSEFPMELSLATWNTGQGTFFSGIIRDVTARLKQLRELATSEAEREALSRDAYQAQEANRIKDEFLATVSHELRTPLTSLLGWARMLRAGDLTETTTKRAVESIERNTLLQARLVEDLLDVSRIAAGKLSLELKWVELDCVVAAAVELVRPQAEAKGLELRVSLARLAEPTLADGTRVQQIVSNLLSNAVKFTPPRGCIEVTLEGVGSRARMRVSDTGCGISAEFLPHVFDRFRHAESFMRREGGLGLGLALARHLVDLHHGTVIAESEGEGRGATFTVELPIGARGLEAVPHAPPATQEVER